MTLLELLAIVALCAYALYRQTRQHEVVGKTQLKLALIYIIIGFVIASFYQPSSPAGWVFLAIDVLLSIVVGVVRAKYTKVRIEKRRVYARGTWLTAALFLLPILTKLAVGTVEYLTNGHDQGGFGEVLLLVGVMVAVQALLVWRRAKSLGGARTVGSRSGAYA